MRRSWRNCCPYGSRRTSGRCVGPPAVGGAPAVEATGPAGWSRRPADAWSRGGPSGRDGRVRGSCGRDGPPLRRPSPPLVCSGRVRSALPPSGARSQPVPPYSRRCRRCRRVVPTRSGGRGRTAPPPSGGRVEGPRRRACGRSRTVPPCTGRRGRGAPPPRTDRCGRVSPTAAGAVACCARPPRRGGPAGPRTRPAGRQSPRRGQAVRGPPGVAGVTGTPRAARPGVEPGGPGAGRPSGGGCVTPRVRGAGRRWCRSPRRPRVPARPVPPPPYRRRRRSAAAPWRGRPR